MDYYLWAAIYFAFLESFFYYTRRIYYKYKMKLSFNFYTVRNHLTRDKTDKLANRALLRRWWDIWFYDLAFWKIFLRLNCQSFFFLFLKQLLVFRLIFHILFSSLCSIFLREKLDFWCIFDKIALQRHSLFVFNKLRFNLLNLSLQIVAKFW